MNTKSYKRWQVKCPVCGEEIKDWLNNQGKVAQNAGVRDSPPSWALRRLMTHLFQHPDVREKFPLDQGCPICGRPIKAEAKRKGKDWQVPEGIRYTSLAQHLAVTHPDELPELLASRGLPIELESVEVPAPVLAGQVEPSAQSAQKEQPAQDEQHEQEEQPPSPDQPPSPERKEQSEHEEQDEEIPLEPEGEEEEVDERDVSGNLDDRIEHSHREPDEEEERESDSFLPPSEEPWASEEARERTRPKKTRKKEGSPWKWALYAAGGLAAVGFLFALVKRFMRKDGPVTLPQGSPQPMGAGTPQMQPGPAPQSEQSQTGLNPDEIMSPAQRRRLAKLPPSIQEKIRRGELSLDEVLSL